MLTPLNRLTRMIVILVAILGVAVGLSGPPVFAQETQPAAPPSTTSASPPPVDAGAMSSAGAPVQAETAATPDALPSEPSDSTGPAAPPQDETTAAQPAESPAPASSSALPQDDTTAGESASAPTPAAPPSAPADTTPAAATAESMLAQALAAYEKQDFATAAEAFKHAIDSDPSSVEAHYYLGYALYKLKRFDESRVAFTQAYQLRSDYLPPVAQAKK
jgi:Flp pilus assembly protein TadD